MTRSASSDNLGCVDSILILAAIVVAAVCIFVSLESIRMAHVRLDKIEEDFYKAEATK